MTELARNKGVWVHPTVEVEVEAANWGPSEKQVEPIVGAKTFQPDSVEQKNGADDDEATFEKARKKMFRELKMASR